MLKLEKLFPRSHQSHTMDKRSSECFQVKRGLTERLRRSAIPYVCELYWIKRLNLHSPLSTPLECSSFYRQAFIFLMTLNSFLNEWSRLVFISSEWAAWWRPGPRPDTHNTGHHNLITNHWIPLLLALQKTSNMIHIHPQPLLLWNLFNQPLVNRIAFWIHPQ